jgi:hypothetical protein
MPWPVADMAPHELHFMEANAALASAQLSK